MEKKPWSEMKNPSPVLGEFLVDQGNVLYFGIMKSFQLQRNKVL